MSASVRMAPRATAAPIVAALVVAACSNPEAANEANFRKVIEPLVADAFCQTLRVYQPDLLRPGEAPPPAWPVVLTAKPPAIEGPAARNLLNQAAAEGSLRRTATMAMARWGTNDPYVRTALVSYEPTGKGRAMFRAVAGKAMNGRRVERPSLCVARGAVDGIVRWTDPAEVFGRTVTRVTYRLTAVDVVAIVPPEMRASLLAPVERTVALERTNEGWRPVDG